MSNYQVTRFNHIAGKQPKGISHDSVDEIWTQIQQQAKLVLEEAKEMYEGAMARDIKEVLDGSCDVWVTREYMDDILSSLDIDVKKAKSETCYNNDQKFTTSLELAEKSAARQFAFVHETVYDGTTYYVVKNENDKILKLDGHVPPDLDKCIPTKTKEKLNGK